MSDNSDRKDKWQDAVYEQTDSLWLICESTRNVRIYSTVQRKGRYLRVRVAVVTGGMGMGPVGCVWGMRRKYSIRQIKMDSGTV
jgi:hypothetical protein